MIERCDGAGGIQAEVLVRRISAELLARNASRIPHSKRTLLAHLRGTYDILRAWKQPSELCLAGLVHSVYSTDSFATNVFELADRDKLRALVGERAEELAFLFASILRVELFQLLLGTPETFTLKKSF